MKRLPKGLSIITHDNKTLAKLYDTLIVVIDNNNNTLKLNTGGWFTRHTAKCMNLVLNETGLKVFQKKGLWYVSKIDGQPLMFNENKVSMSLEA